MRPNEIRLDDKIRSDDKNLDSTTLGYARSAFVVTTCFFTDPISLVLSYVHYVVIDCVLCSGDLVIIKVDYLCNVCVLAD